MWSWLATDAHERLCQIRGTHPGFVVAIGIHLFAHVRAQRVLESWMRERSYPVITRERRSLHAGPFSMGHSNFQIVYRIDVETHQA